MRTALAALTTREGWGRALAGFRQHYGLDLRDALWSQRREDVEELVARLPPEWSPHQENVAMLVDRLDFLLNAEYAQWTTDPQDPDLEAERDRRRRQGVEPPPFPLLRPVAQRPAHIHEAHVAAYEAAREHWADPPTEKATFEGLVSLFGAARVIDTGEV